MPSIQPYELFALTHKATLQDVRKAYYDMALMCHPDKGGSAEDMQTINAAYAWLKKGLEGVAPLVPDVPIEYDELLAEYKPEHAPTLLEIKGEIIGLPRDEFPYDDDFLYRCSIHKWQMETDEFRADPEHNVREYAIAFAKEHMARQSGSEDPDPSRLYPASIPHGYDDLIQHTTLATLDDPGDDPNTTVQSFSKSTDIMEFSEPLHHMLRSVKKGANTVNAEDVELPSKLDDYSIDGSASDYELAFSTLVEHGQWSSNMTECKLSYNDCSP